MYQIKIVINDENTNMGIKTFPTNVNHDPQIIDIIKKSLCVSFVGKLINVRMCLGRL